MEKFYLTDFKGEAVSGSVLIAPDETVRLPDNECKFVMLSLWNALDDETFDRKISGGGGIVEDSDGEVYFGFDGVLFDQLFPSRRTELFPINNTKKIVLRATPKVAVATRVYYTFFK